MIHFQCPHCAQKLTLSDEQAGRELQCPRCRSRIAIPPATAPLPTGISAELLATPGPPDDLTHARALPKGEGGHAAPASDALDRRLLDVPPAGSGSVPERRLSNEEALAKLRSRPAPECSGARGLPWPIDILLYPATVAGVANLAIVVVIPLFLTVLQDVVFLPFLRLPFFLAQLAVGLYAAWYWAECTYDSAMGGTRAPGLFDKAGAGDMWSRVSRLLPVYTIFVLPTVLYARYGDRNAIIIGILLAWAVVFFPMGLLAMVVNDGMYVLNPLFLLGAIRRTFLPYSGLLLLLAASGVPVWLVLGLLRRGNDAIWWAGPALLTGGYLSLIASHILGRFCWRYRQRLGWDL
jgi:DNA-directed RNA polymerase subunit RPC12/RpoP